MIGAEMGMNKKISLFLLIPLLSILIFSCFTNIQSRIEYNQNHNLESTAYLYSINGNAQLSSAASSGNGTLSNPFIIENLNIVGGGSLDFCIYIQNTDKYFILRNCTATNGQQAITLNNVSHAIIEDCLANDSNYGIVIQFCFNDILIHNSTVSHTTQIGIYLYASNYTTVFNNTLYHCLPTAINSNMRGFNNLTYNRIHGGGNGIYVDNSNNNSITFNSIYSNSGTGIILHSADNCTIIDNNSTQNTRGIYSETSSTNNDYIRNNASDNTWGIWLDWSNIGRLLNNTANFNNIL